MFSAKYYYGELRLMKWSGTQCSWDKREMHICNFAEGPYENCSFGTITVDGKTIKIDLKGTECEGL
jgi:hypothetical protein